MEEHSPRRENIFLFKVGEEDGVVARTMAREPTRLRMSRPGIPDSQGETMDVRNRDGQLRCAASVQGARLARV